MQHNYPEAVGEWLEKSYEIVESIGFISDNELDPVNAKQSFYEIAGEVALTSWINNGEINIGEEAMIEILKTTLIKTVITGLQEKGLMDSIEDENGEEAFFVTEAGKQAVQEYNKQLSE